MLKVNFALKQASAVDVMGGQRQAPAALPSERPCAHCIGGWADRRTGLDGCGMSPTGIRSPDRPARSESLYRLSYPGSHPQYISAFMIDLYTVFHGLAPSFH